MAAQRGEGAPGEYIRAVPTPQYDPATLEGMRERLRSEGVEYCMATYTDVHGIAKCKTVPIDHFDAMMHGSELFTGAALDMLGQSPADDELAVWPDLDAIVQLPWRPNVAFAPGNLYFHDEPYPMCPRTVLTRQAERAREQGFVFNLGIETEFFFVRTASSGAGSRGTRATRSTSPATTSSGCSSSSTSSTRWSAT